jgi:hypothetical protein
MLSHHMRHTVGSPGLHCLFSARVSGLSGQVAERTVSKPSVSIAIPRLPVRLAGLENAGPTSDNILSLNSKHAIICDNRNRQWPVL